MTEPPVSDSSPLIVTSRAGQLHLLRVVNEIVCLPRAVLTEIRRYGPYDRTVRAIADTPWLVLVDVPEVAPVVRAWRLGDGESEVLSWALNHPGCEAIIDDSPARRRARALGIPVIGTAGVVLRAKQRGVIPAARPILERLRREGLYLSDRVLDEALTLVGE